MFYVYLAMRKLTRCIVPAIAFLAVMGGIIQFHQEWGEAGHGLDLSRAILHMASLWFNLDTEQAIPAWFSSMLWVLLGLELILVREMRLGPARSHPGIYLLMALVCIYFSIDEAVGLHEWAPGIMGKLLRINYTTWWIWLSPFAAAGIVLFWIGLRVLRELPGDVQWLTLGGAVVFVGAAAGLENVGAWLAGHQFILAANIEVICEETLEMVGVLLAIIGQTRFIGHYAGEALTEPPERGIVGAAGSAVAV